MNNKMNKFDITIIATTIIGAVASVIGFLANIKNPRNNK